MQLLELFESGPPEQHTLSNDMASLLNRMRIATVTPAGGDEWIVANVRKVGVIRFGEHQILIRPKVPVSRLFFMMQYALHPKMWLDEPIQLDSDQDLLSVMAMLFLQQVSKIRQNGIIQGYKTFNDALPMMRGRLDIAAQIGRRGGLALPVETVYDEFTTDIPENRILVSALHRLLKLPMLDPAHRAGLHKLSESFVGVNILIPGQELPVIRYTRINARYRQAIFLSEVILRNTSVEQINGNLTARAFLFDMWKVFEDFVTVALSNCFADMDGKATRQETGTFLDEGARLALRPDLVWHGSNQRLAIVDAKYKAPDSANYPNADIYQMLAYCVRFGLNAGHLVYASGPGTDLSHAIIGHASTVHCHAVDLAQPPSELLSQMSSLALKIINSGPHTSTGSNLAQFIP
ncbi:McrC family protein [Glutamicibacter nicotianae]|nr:restriction endonuclease [Glutamicibacter nicotianae]